MTMPPTIMLQECTGCFAHMDMIMCLFLMEVTQSGLPRAEDNNQAQDLSQHHLKLILTMYSNQSFTDSSSKLFNFQRISRIMSLTNNFLMLDQQVPMPLAILMKLLMYGGNPFKTVTVLLSHHLRSDQLLLLQELISIILKLFHVKLE